MTVEDTVRTEVDLEEKVAFLRRAESYPHLPADVEAVETHMAWVFLAGFEAYKLKKPVRYAFLDFSTLEARRRDCHEEVRLNRRLAPDVYRGVTPLRRTPKDGLTLDAGAADGEVVEWLVRMRRLPADRMLDVRMQRGEVGPADVWKVLERLVRFYRSVPRIPLGTDEYRGRFDRDIREIRRELSDPRHGLPVGRSDAVAERLLDLLGRRAHLFDVRVQKGRIVEGHGDLRPEHVCLEEEPVIIDCLEFSPAFRTVDPADEVSFLAMECARLGAPDLGQAFLGGYSRLSGDDVPADLLGFYRSYRAFLRAKIAIWHTQDHAIRDQHRKWVERARTYLELAEESCPPS